MADSFDSEKPHRDAGNDIIGHFGLPITFDNRLLVFFLFFFPCCGSNVVNFLIREWVELIPVQKKFGEDGIFFECVKRQNSQIPFFLSPTASHDSCRVICPRARGPPWSAISMSTSTSTTIPS